MCHPRQFSYLYEHSISKLTHSFSFQLRRLRAIRKSVSSSTFTPIVHDFVCSRLDYNCISPLVRLIRVGLSPYMLSVLNASAREKTSSILPHLYIHGCSSHFSP